MPHRRLTLQHLAQATTLAIILLGPLGLSLLFACGSPPPDSKPTPTASAPTAPFPPADAGRIEGQITYNGPDPDVAVPLSADPTCAKLHTGPLETEKIVGDGAGHLGNVFVYIKAGLAPRTYPTPTENAEIDQNGCAYRPHILGLRAGQTLLFKNSDPTIHNVFAQTQANPQFNRGLPQAGMSFEKTFEKPEVMVTLHCNVHPWMTAYVGVLDHPYFAVTGPDGKFSIGDVPPGTYTVGVWHETLGVREAVVTVEKGEVGRVGVGFGTVQTGFIGNTSDRDHR
ncbi:MAG: hypothetical protein ABJC13_03685 [Acidobacteriota bacterium]